MRVIERPFTSDIMPFPGRDSVDILRLRDQNGLTSAFSVFSIMQNAHRTKGFFEGRGINNNLTEFEVLLFRIPKVNHSKVELLNDGGSDIRAIEMDIKRSRYIPHALQCVRTRVRETFEVYPEINFIENSSIAKEFEASVTAPRHLDNEG